MTRPPEVQTQTLFDLVGGVYEAAAEPQGWPRFLTAFGKATGSEGTVIWMHDFADASARMAGPDISFACDVDFAPGFIESYAEHYTYTNPWMKRIDALPEGACAHSSAIYQDARLHGSEFYGDWLRPQGLGFAMGGPILKRGSVVAMFTFMRLERIGAYGENDLRLMRLMMPHLRRACLLHQRLARLRSERGSALAALELLPTAVWLLDDDGRLLLANRAGRDLDRCRDGLWVDRDGRPVADDPDERRTLQRCISASIAAGRGLGAAGDCASHSPSTQRAAAASDAISPRR